jgi:hypothetical protein
MIRTKTALFLALLIAGLVFLQSFHIKAQSQANTPVVRIDPVQTVNLNIGDNFTISVWVDDASNVMATQVQFTYDRTVLEAVDIEEGSFLTSHGTTIMAQHEADPVAGSETLGEVYFADAGTSYPYLSVNGSGILCNVTFTVLSIGSQQFHLLPFVGGISAKGTVLEDYLADNFVPTLQDAFYGSPVSLTASPESFLVGDFTTLAGKISGTVARNITSVDLQYSSMGSNWTDLGQLPTNSSGGFSSSWTSKEVGFYQFRVSYLFAGTISYSVIVSVSVQPALHGYGIYVLYAFIGVIVLIVAVSIIGRIRGRMRAKVEHPPLD